MLRQKVAPVAEFMLDNTPILNSKNRIGKTIRYAVLLALITPGSCVGIATCSSYVAFKFGEEEVTKVNKTLRHKFMVQDLLND